MSFTHCQNIGIFGEYHPSLLTLKPKERII